MFFYNSEPKNLIAEVENFKRSNLHPRIMKILFTPLPFKGGGYLACWQMLIENIL